MNRLDAAAGGAMLFSVFRTWHPVRSRVGGPLRAECVGALYHVMDRGNRQETVFRRQANYVQGAAFWAATTLWSG